MHKSKCQEFLNIIEGHDIKKEVSEYAATDNFELLAEAFAIYIFSQKKLSNLEKQLNINTYDNVGTETSELITQIGGLIDKKYKEFTKYRKLMFYNKLYNFNKNFIIDKKSKNNYVIPYEKLKTLYR